MRLLIYNHFYTDSYPTGIRKFGSIHQAWTYHFGIMTRRQESIHLVTLVLLVSSLCLGTVTEALQNGYYLPTCPLAELLVNDVVSKAVFSDRTNGAALIRLLFHDCFVEGCDASISLDGPNSEKTAVPNLSLRGFDIIDQAKARVEAVCPGVVSCADIIAMAARDSYAALGGGIRFPIKTGRLDGTVSLASETGDIPSPFSTADAVLSSFANKGLNTEQTVLLSGAHTVGKAQCAAFSQRLYPTVDPTLDPNYAAQLKIQCPQGGSPSVLNNMDVVSPSLFDNFYYTNLLQNKGLFTSDQSLATSAATQALVTKYALNPVLFNLNFIGAFNAMAEVGVKTAGQVRTNCRAVNP
ncbi:hypothetical protein R1flu_025794 [Riccia fluitans]|uniref:Peroxidase n=1 Tax=Riccia fluitans TaxID=41844 RepID=A0ABD1XYS0_9MARC